MDPYEKLGIELWKNKTEELINKHPLNLKIADLCLKSWESILNSKINTYLNLRIRDMRISPQATGALLHDIIPEYVVRNVKGFRKGIGGERDIVCESDDFFSFEIKTSSQTSIFGNKWRRL